MNLNIFTLTNEYKQGQPIDITAPTLNELQEFALKNPDYGYLVSINDVPMCICDLTNAELIFHKYKDCGESTRIIDLVNWRLEQE